MGEKFDVIVIGGGPGGYLAAERAGHEGFNTLVIEKRRIGGVCLNEGCIPTKTLLYSAKLYDGAKNGEKYGVKVKDIEIDHSKVIQRKTKVVDTLVRGVQATLKRLGVKVVEGEGKIIAKTADGFKIGVGNDVYEGQKVIIATGSSSIVPPIEGVKEGIADGSILTNREILDMADVPERFVVIGGGVIGLEMASYFSSIGSEVTVVEMLDRIGGQIDSEIASILQRNYEKKGVNFKLGAKVVKVKDGKVYYEKDGKLDSVQADKVLLSIGRRANVDNLGLEKVQVFVENGIKTDETGQTNISGIYAIGDVNGKSMLAHTAYREAEVAVNNIAGRKDTMKYSAIPSVIYTNPEVAGVGETEETAKNKGMDITVKSLPMQYSGRYVAENEGGNGIIKIVVDNKTNTLIGVHLIANYASELIIGAVAMIDKKMTIEQIKKIVFPHPSVCESIREAIFTL